MKKIFTLIFVSTLSFAAIKTETVEYKSDGTVLEGYLAYDDSLKDKRPGVVIVHNWMGLGEGTKERAQQLAALGYVAFAADIYGKGVRPNNPKDAGAEAGKYKAGDRKLLQTRAHAALETLKKQKNVDSSKLGTMGYCFGGTTALEMGRAGEKLKAIVSFHGGLDNPKPENAKKIKGKVLVLHGAIDPYVPADQVNAFQKEMNDAKVDYQFVAYSGAVHAFTEKSAGSDISKGAAYNENADHRSWEAMKTFFAETFK